MYAVLPVDSVNPAVTFDGIIAIGGKVYTEISSVGGPAITLATSGVGVVTSFAGSVYTVATSSAGTAATGSGYAPKSVNYLKANNLFFRNAAVANIRPLHISAPMLAALAATAGGVLFGAWVAV